MTEQSRVDPPTVADERALLQGFLDFHRGTLLWKLSGLTGEQLVERAVPPSTMSLIGLVRHMSEVEKYWFHRALALHDSPPKNWSREFPDGDFDHVDPELVEQDLEEYRQIVKTSDALAANYALDDTFLRPGQEPPHSLRYLYNHMIQEYARHNGHADLLRQRLDGATGE
ncbi:DinB family protein [Kribbella sindirgiensis]|uniref:DinB family protein n=1 Tax=Kribbella sindirgiensis TaxID=1124744 RepID=UPI001EDD42FD|nr:DinB family protein [Kribbella sindirgiensis]